MEYNYKWIVEPLLEWFDANKRELPWRQNPKPYYVWISEIMLQQTRVEAVKGYFHKFIETLPDIYSLSNVEEDKLLKLWEGLGYYNRARNLKKAACQIMEEYNGNLPESYEQLLKLSGIGTYTAGAIASIAFGIQVPAVDGNVLRVTKRLAGSFDDILKSSVKKELENSLGGIIPKRAGDFNQALMDLGAMVCIPNGKPLCEKCPMHKGCVAAQKGITDQIPVKKKKKPRKIEDKTVLIIEYQGKFALHKRERKGLLAGLWELPNMDGHFNMEKLNDFLQNSNLSVENIEHIGEAKHIFSHIEWHMLGYYIRLGKSIGASDFVWIEKIELEEQYALPSAFRYFQGKIT